MGELCEPCESRAGAHRAAPPSRCAGELVHGGDRAVRNARGFCKPTAYLASCCPQLSPKLFHQSNGAFSDLWLLGPTFTPPQATRFPLTILLPQWETTDILAHGHEAVEVLLQALICLLLQSRDDSELSPVEGLFLLVIDNPKGGDSAVEICLFPPGPPVGQGGDRNTTEMWSGPSKGLREDYLVLPAGSGFAARRSTVGSYYTQRSSASQRIVRRSKGHHPSSSWFIVGNTLPVV